MAFQMQFERVKRFRRRIEIPPDEDKDTPYLDDVWSFFIHAWSLKDWIKNDYTIPQIDIETIVKKYPTLMVCADIANGAKHFKTDTLAYPPPRVGAKQKSLSVTVKVGKGTSDYKLTFTDDSGNIYDPLVLAKEIEQAWQNIVDKYI